LRNERELPPRDGVEGVHGLVEGVDAPFEGGQVLRLDRMGQFDETRGLFLLVLPLVPGIA